MNAAVLQLAAALPDHVVAGYRKGDRVSVTYQGVTAYGTVTGVHYGKPRKWQTVRLDGTEQEVSVHESMMDLQPTVSSLSLTT